MSDAWLIERLKQIHSENRGVYGSRRVRAERRLGQGVVVSRTRVQRRMRHADLSELVRVKRVRTTIRVPGVRVADDLVEARPSGRALAGRHRLPQDEGWVYLAAFGNAHSRRIVGWSMAEHMRLELVVDALQTALHRRRPAPGLIHHSDMASQFVSLAFGHKAATPGSPSLWAPKATATTTPSPRASSPRSRRSSSTARSWPTRRELISEVFEFVTGFYNTTRRHSTLGYLSPADFRKINPSVTDKETG